jgi:hypothetical protein
MMMLLSKCNQENRSNSPPLEQKLADAIDLAGDDSSSDEVDESLFIENLEQLAASGELDSLEGVKQANLNAFGESL